VQHRQESDEGREVDAHDAHDAHDDDLAGERVHRGVDGDDAVLDIFELADIESVTESPPAV
jgi:hypothetical protein